VPSSRSTTTSPRRSGSIASANCWHRSRTAPPSRSDGPKPDDHRGETVTVPAYRDHELVDVVTDRVSTGLAAGALDHGAVRELADWADGNAHDALAALFGAAVLASEDEADRIESPPRGSADRRARRRRARRSSARAFGHPATGVARARRYRSE